MAKNPYDFDLDGAVSLIIQLAGGTLFTVWSCITPAPNVLPAVGGLAGGAWAITESFKLGKSARRAQMFDDFEDEVLVEDLTHQYTQVIEGASYIDYTQSPDHQLPASNSPLPLPVQTNDRNAHELWDRLNQPQYEWLLQLLLTKPLLIWGAQGSGKSQMAQFIAMLRQLFFNHKVSVADPHSHINKWYFECHGREYNYAAINERLKAYYERLKHPDTPHTSVWDEVTQYDENCNSEESKRFLKSILSDVRKPPEFPILLSHNNTLATLGGGKGGVKKMQVDGLPELELRATRDRLGNIKPAYCGILTNTNQEGEMTQQAIIVEPDWMNVDYLLRKFPYLAEGQSASQQTHIQGPPGQPRSQMFQNIDLDKTPIDVDVVDHHQASQEPDNFQVSFSQIPDDQIIKQIIDISDLSVETIQAVIQAIRSGESDSAILKSMGYTGRKYQAGKNLLANIKEFL